MPSVLAQFYVICLAAGLSRRFAAPKVLAAFAGRPMYTWTFETLAQLDALSVLVVTNHDEVGRAAVAQGFVHVTCPGASEGKSASIRAGLAKAAELACAERAKGVFFTVLDQPCLSPRSFQRLAEEALRNEMEGREPEILYPLYGGLRKASPHLFPMACLPELEALRGEEGGSSLLGRFPSRGIPMGREIEGIDVDSRERMALLEQRVLAGEDWR